MLAQRFLRVKGQAKITKCNFLWVGGINMQSLSGHYLMCQKVPMAFLLPLVYLGAVVYISVEISLGSFWRRDILRVKGQALFTNCNFYDSVWYAIIEWPLFDVPSSTHVVFTSLVYLSAVAYISVEVSLGFSWCRDILRVKDQGFITKLQLFMTLCDMQSSSGNFSMRHQVPMVFLLLLIYLSAVTCISEERNLGQCWRKDILRVKGQA